jgi:pilus assembly protein CpaC
MLFFALFALNGAPVTSGLAPVAVPFISVARAEDDAPIDVGVGESVIRKEARPLSRVLISSPDVAEIKILEEGQFQIRGVQVGTTDLWVWYRDDVNHPRVYRVQVQNDLSEMTRRITAAVNGPAPRVYPIKDRVVVEGEVADLETAERIASIANIYDKNFVNLLTVKGDSQVQLHVTFAEVSRTGLRELGLNILGQSGGNQYSLTGPGSTVGATAATAASTAYPNINGNQVSSPAAGVFNLIGLVTSTPINITAILSVLEEYDLARTLAQPTLVSLSGQQAEFLAGGEIPIPIGQNNGQISLEFKEYGVKLVFVPTVLAGNVIDLRTYVEVSELDEANSLKLVGVDVPAFVMRKADSHLRIADGMTFAMAGMLKERSRAFRSQIPILGDLPILGSLFRYVKHGREETEVVIFVTPELVRPMAAAEVPAAPGSTENYNPNDFDLFLMGTIVKPGSRSAAPTGAVGLQR